MKRAVTFFCLVIFKRGWCCHGPRMQDVKTKTMINASTIAVTIVVILFSFLMVGLGGV
jgi:hypothetical protein